MTGPDAPFPRLDAREEPAPGPRSASERRQSRFLLNCTWRGGGGGGSPREGLGAWGTEKPGSGGLRGPASWEGETGTNASTGAAFRRCPRFEG